MTTDTLTTDQIIVIREDDWHDDLTRQEAERLAVPEWEVEEAYDALLNDLHEPVVVIGLTYDPATVLRRVDPIAYRVGMSDFTAQEYRELYVPDLPDECLCAIGEPCACTAYDDTCTCAASYLGNSWHTPGCGAATL